MNDEEEEKTLLPRVIWGRKDRARWVAMERRASLWRMRSRETEEYAEVFEDDDDYLKEEKLTAIKRNDCQDLVSRGALRVPGVVELLLGARDPKSSLYTLRGFELVLRTIATRLAELYADDWIEKDGIFAVAIAKVRFPQPNGRYCNMMPIRIGDISTIPREYHDYIPLLAACPVSRDDWNEIGYLSIDEGIVQAGSSQRRPGLHVEAPTLGLRDNINFKEMNASHMPLTLPWGRGYIVKESSAGKTRENLGNRVKLKNGVYGHFEGGLFMASNTQDSCRVYNCKTTPQAPQGPLGDLEHLRRFMPPGHNLNKGTLVWLCDQAPHESLSLERNTHRQFFRLVTRHVSVWYAAHSTPNPLCPLPSHVHVINSNKFISATSPSATSEDDDDEDESTSGFTSDSTSSG